jgi:hypothetical protein
MALAIRLPRARREAERGAGALPITSSCSAPWQCTDLRSDVQGYTRAAPAGTAGHGRRQAFRQDILVANLDRWSSCTLGALVLIGTCFVLVSPRSSAHGTTLAPERCESLRIALGQPAALLTRCATDAEEPASGSAPGRDRSDGDARGCLTSFGSWPRNTRQNLLNRREDHDGPPGTSGEKAAREGPLISRPVK